MMRATKSSIKILGLAFRPTKNAAFYFSSQATMNAVIPSEKENILELSPQEFRKINHIKLEGSGSSDYEPIISFDAAPFHSKLKNALRKQGYTQPTATQSQSWSIALAKRDIISIARTGSGKTCGFLIPAIHALLSKSTITDTNIKKTSYKFRKPSILILAPTRELAVQIENEAYKIGSLCGVGSIALYGGVAKGPQIKALRSGVDIVIATPGRCNDLIDDGYFDPSDINYLVLDEADRMLDMGFEPQIRQIIDNLSAENRQTLFFTATWPKEVQKLAHSFLNNPVYLKIGENDGLQANKAITQNIEILKESEKSSRLLEILKEINPSDTPSSCPKTLVFVSRKIFCEELVSTLRDEGYKSDCLHGDKSQALRSSTMEKFKLGKTSVLIATDIAARGLDVKDIKTVINFDFPSGASGVEDYVHRIGRTARGESSGVAYSFITRADSDRVKDLIKVLEGANQLVPDDLKRMLISPKRNDNMNSRSFDRNRNDRFNDRYVGKFKSWDEGRGTRGRGGGGFGSGSSSGSSSSYNKPYKNNKGDEFSYGDRPSKYSQRSSNRFRDDDFN